MYLAAPINPWRYRQGVLHLIRQIRLIADSIVLTSDIGFPSLRNRSTAREMRRSISKLNRIQQKRGMLMISGAIMSIDNDPRDNEQVNKS